ncbi:pantoate--beta-alanine ligase [Aequorivita echinoideorum]|uniref:Pantothenate synthetase n=1 Tax=Aequorivita echinoideorum TaxID=1549647 RepID=A0ABS5S143_9FLAO|nr:pantoate--beta-alanine ligase [Aequorivita echinoideorum]MBT0606922.1 pantoate--beta-alanine ligase [Aequorivita echinoideorum]
MVLYTHKKDLKNALDSFRGDEKIGFVPTMGALHKGHLSLVEKALDENDVVVVSIFVNPTQFNNAEDLKKYPRTLNEDCELLKSLNKNILVYAPEISDIYEDKVAAKNYDYGGLENEMEGKHRKGHFNGVGTILNSLFRIIEPDFAYLGEKDFQQLQIVKQLVEIEKLPVTIIGCPIVREENGLAMSSRNKRLSPQLFEEASIIYKILTEVRRHFKEKTLEELNQMVTERFLSTPNLNLEYFEIADEKTLKSASSKSEDAKYRAFVAVFAGDVRLIDNMPLN